MSLVLLIGGARSGKSSLAVEIGRAFGGDVVFVATAEARDEAMAARIARHRRDRPQHWFVVEEPLAVADVAALGAEDERIVIIDCLTLWLANLLDRGRSDDEVMTAVSALTQRTVARRAPVVVVSNEVGLGVVPATELGGRFRDVQGAANRIVSACASPLLFVIAGRALELAPVAIVDLVAAMR